MDSKWVFKRKVSEKGLTICRARLVIRGFRDLNKYELSETYAPLSKLNTNRSLLVVINKYNLEVVQLDVKTAFLNGILNDNIYVEIPEGTEHNEKTRKIKIYKLSRAAYGLKVSPKKWNQKFNEEVNKMGMENDIHDPYLYTWRLDDKMVLMALYVDDIILASNNPEKLREIKDKLCKTFKMKDLGEPKVYLGMRVTRDRGNQIINFDQSEYTEKILERFGMKESKGQQTPMITRQVKNREIRASENSEENRVCNVPYR